MNRVPPAGFVLGQNRPFAKASLDPRAALSVAPAVAQAAVRDGVAPRTLHLAAYRESLRRRLARKTMQDRVEERVRIGSRADGPAAPAVVPLAKDPVPDRPDYGGTKMKPALTACEKCGLREVRHELERKGVMIRFCEECYWGEISETGEVTEAPSPTRTGKPAGADRRSA